MYRRHEQPSLVITLRWMGKFIGQGGVYAQQMRKHGVSYHVEKGLSNNAYIYVKGFGKSKVIPLLNEQIKQLEELEQIRLEELEQTGRASRTIQRRPIQRPGPVQPTRPVHFANQDFPELKPKTSKTPSPCPWQKPAPYRDTEDTELAKVCAMLGTSTPLDAIHHLLTENMKLQEALAKSNPKAVILKNCPLYHSSGDKITNRSFLHVFSAFGSIEHFKIVSMEHGDVGTCIIEYAQEWQATNVKSTLSGCKMEGKPLCVL